MQRVRRMSQGIGYGLYRILKKELTNPPFLHMLNSRKKRRQADKFVSMDEFIRFYMEGGTV